MLIRRVPPCAPATVGILMPPVCHPKPTRSIRWRIRPRGSSEVTGRCTSAASPGCCTIGTPCRWGCCPRFLEPERSGEERTTPVSVRDVARLDRELATVLGARARDPKACADVLERAAFACRTDPAAAGRWVEAELLDELVDCYEALGRVDEAITVMRRALQVGWAGVPEGRCRIAELLMRDGRVEQATEIWEQVRVDTPDDVWLYHNAGVEYGEIDDHETALTWLTHGLRLAMATGDPEGLVEQLADLREESLSELGRREDQLQRDAEEFLDNPPPPPGRRHRVPGTAPAAARPATIPAVWPPAGSAVPATATAPTAQYTPRRQTQVPVAFAWFPATDYP